MAIASMARPLAASGDVKIIGWVGDLLPYQITALFTTKRMIDERADALRGFCAAYRHGVADYRAAFLTPGASDAVAVAQLRKIRVHVRSRTADARIREGIGWYDDGAALDVDDVKAQLAWFEAQGMVKGAIDPGDIIDTRFLPAR